MSKLVHSADGGKWPKRFPPLTEEQKRISDDFMKYWHEVLPRRYGLVDDFNHKFVVDSAPANFVRTLEIGAGLGEHLAYERLTKSQMDNYYAVDIRENMIAELHRRYPGIKAIVADCQGRMDFEDQYFDRILAIHVLEHLPNLPQAVREMHRLCRRHEGILQMVIPCEGGLAYSLARQVSAKRIFERRYKQPYDWFIEREHINRPDEILEELAPYFQPVKRTYFPLRMPSIQLNLCLGINLVPKERC